MIQNPKTSALQAFNFDRLKEEVPELVKFNFSIETLNFKKAIDSSNVDVNFWLELSETIESEYNSYDGFVVLHGTDTMAYTASALSFILKGLSKPVILTGSQLPIGMVRTDGKENLISAIEIAATRKGNAPVISEVAIYFENELHRGNRTIKLNAAHFNAFSSPNYTDLAKAGIFIHYNYDAIHSYKKNTLQRRVRFCQDVVIIKLFPGLTEKVFQSMIDIPGLKGIVLETFGSGNAPQFDWFISLLEKAVNKDILIVNVTQCIEGFVVQGRYESSAVFNRLGIVNGLDLTTEAALVKLMMVLAMDTSVQEMKNILLESWAGELTVSSIL
jgi:L-asparaginase